MAGSGKSLLQELVLGRVWCQRAWERCLWAGREGPPGCVCVCAQEEGGRCGHAGNTGLGTGTPGFSLLCGSPRTLALNLAEPQFSQLLSGDAKNLPQGVV